MSSLQPNPPSKSHANTFTHTHTQECTLTLSPSPVSVASPSPAPLSSSSQFLLVRLHFSSYSTRCFFPSPPPHFPLSFPSLPEACPREPD